MHQNHTQIIKGRTQIKPKVSDTKSATTHCLYNSKENVTSAKREAWHSFLLSGSEKISRRADFARQQWTQRKLLAERNHLKRAKGTEAGTSAFLRNGKQPRLAGVQVT